MTAEASLDNTDSLACNGNEHLSAEVMASRATFRELLYLFIVVALLLSLELTGKRASIVCMLEH